MTGTFEGVGSLQFTPDNKRAYAFSGIVGVDENEITLLEWRSESEYLEGLVLFNYYDNDSDAYRCRIYFNDVVVQGFVYYGKKDYKDNNEYPVPIIVPSFTNVKLTLQNIDNTNERSHIVSFTSKVKGAIQQENLESITNNNKWASL